MKRIVLILFIFAMEIFWTSALSSLHSYVSAVDLSRPCSSRTRLRMASPGPTQHNIDIVCREFEITPALKARVEAKVGKVMAKLSGGLATSAHIVLRVHKFNDGEHHTHKYKKNSQTAEATVRMKGGIVINAKQSTDDMNASIDLLSHKLASMIRKHNEITKKQHMRIKDQEMFEKEFDTTLDEDEEMALIDEEYKSYPIINDPNTFSMPPIRYKTFETPPLSDEDAVLALHFVNHPFYVFRNKKTGAINIAYKRDNGGVGIIIPEELQR